MYLTRQPGTSHPIQKNQCPQQNQKLQNLKTGIRIRRRNHPFLLLLFLLLPSLRTSSISTKDTRKRQKESPDESPKNKKQDTRNKNEYNVRIYRSKDDPNELPIKITPNGSPLRSLATRASTASRQQCSEISLASPNIFEDEILTPSLGQLRKVDHPTFLRLQRIQQYDPQ